MTFYLQTPFCCILDRYDSLKSWLGMSKNKTAELPVNTLWQFVWHYLKTRKIYVAGMILVGIAWCIEMAANPYLLKSIIDTAI